LPWKKLAFIEDVAVLSDIAPVDVDFLAAAAGTGTEASRYDHKHSVPEATLADLAAVDGGAAATGTVNRFVRADHKHALGPLVATLDFAAQEAKDLSLYTVPDLPEYQPTTWKEGAIAFYTYDDHPYVYVL